MTGRTREGGKKGGEMATVEEQAGIESTLADAPPSAQVFWLRDIGWEGYLKLLEVLEPTRVRVNYENGDAELMSPLPIHEIWNSRLRFLVGAIAEELQLSFLEFGSTTMKKRSLDRGFEADASYYLRDLARIEKPLELSMDKDPPPDLVIEVENTRGVRPKLSVYAAFGVPEVWSCKENGLAVLALGEDQKYRQADESRFWPFVPMAGVAELVHQSEWTNTMVWMKGARAWVREVVLPAYQAWQARAGGEA